MESSRTLQIPPYVDCTVPQPVPDQNPTFESKPFRNPPRPRSVYFTGDYASVDIIDSRSRRTITTEEWTYRALRDWRRWAVFIIFVIGTVGLAIQTERPMYPDWFVLLGCYVLVAGGLWL